MDKDRIIEAFSDEAFAREFFQLEEPGQAQAALQERGVEMTVSEIKRLRDEVTKLASTAGDENELSLEQLETAAGGGVVEDFTRFLKLIGRAIGQTGV